MDQTALFGYLKNYCHIWNQHARICTMAKFRAKIKILKCRIKNALFRCFGQQLWKTVVIFEIWICPIAKFGAKIIALKFGNKQAWFGYLWAGSWKYYCYNWNQRPRICLIAKFGTKIKIFKFGTKNALLGYVWAGMSK